MHINDIYFVYKVTVFVDSSWQIFIEIVILNTQWRITIISIIIIIVIIITIYKYYPDICRGFTLCVIVKAVF
jgi:hypothetical protein